MPLPRAVARFNRRITNPLQLHWAGTLPGFGIVEHVGRRSGRPYRTPVNVFAAPGGFAIALTYGTGADWLRNVQAAGGGTLVHRRRRYRVSAPELVTGGAARALLPRPVRVATRLLRVDTVLQVSAVPA